MRSPGLCTYAGWLGLAALIAGGCASTVRQHGDSRLPARYQAVTLTAEVPGPATVESTMAAFEATLTEIGYTISRMEVRPGSGSLSGYPPGAGRFESIIVTARGGPDATLVKITIGPWGDEIMSRAILEDALTRMGM